MNTYRCIACGYIYKDDIPFESLSDDWKCPLCDNTKNNFEIADEFTNEEVSEVINSETTPYNAVIIDENNPSIERIDGCINCGLCTKTCLQREKMSEDPKCLVCVGCGQCVITCPKKVLQPKNDIYKFLKAKEEGKTCIAYIAPATRVSIGDTFGYEPGEFLEEKLVGVLKQIGFNYVFDVAFGADLTIMEEATELVERLKNKKNLPMMSSCCPSWVRYAEIFYPELLNHLSTTKSPIAMEGTIVKNYFASLKNINKEDIYTVAITPCTAKKWEIIREEIDDTDCVITVAELSEYLHKQNIDLKNVEDKTFDDIMGSSSGAGLIFGNTGGVLEAAIRTTYHMITNEDMKDYKLDNIRGYNGIKEGTFKLGEYELKVCAIDEMANALPVLETIKNKTCKYDFIEIMNCRGGCIGGGGQPPHKIPFEEKIKKARIESLYKKDEEKKIKYSYQNPSIIKLYNEYLNHPGSFLSEVLLHTTYKDLSYLKNILK